MFFYQRRNQRWFYAKVAEVIDESRQNASFLVTYTLCSQFIGKFTSKTPILVCRSGLKPRIAAPDVHALKGVVRKTKVASFPQIDNSPFSDNVPLVMMPLSDDALK